MPAHNLIVILGQTASGKSKLGIQLAKKFSGVVISADSRQVYRGMNIGTGKVTKKEMFGVPHFLLDVASPRGQYSVSRFASDVKRVLRQIDPSVPIFLVGGSPFYIRAVTEPGSFSAVPPNQSLRRRLDALSTRQLRNILNKKDRNRAKNIDPDNRRRLIRAIEIATDQSPPARVGVAQSAGVVGAPTLPAMRVLKLGIRIPRKSLYKKIDRRVDQRLKQGMIAEVRRLHAAGLPWTRLEAFGLEYRFISRYLRKQLTKGEMTSQLKSATHDFAKRQMTWWKREKDIRWVTKPSHVANLARRFLDQ